MPNHPQTFSPDGPRWWLFVDNRADGPHSRAYLIACLQTGQIGADSLACPEGTQEWRPIAAWPQLAAGLSGIAPPSYTGQPALPSDAHSLRAADVGVLTNQRLPPMANWICSYCIAVSPVLWLIQNMSCCVTGLTFHENSDFLWLEIPLHAILSAISLAVTITLAIGGLRLRDLKRSGIRLVTTAIWVALAAGAVSLIAWVLLITIASMSEADQFAEQNTAAEIIVFGLFVVGICELAFMLVSLIWLNRNKNKLGLLS